MSATEVAESIVAEYKLFTAKADHLSYASIATVGLLSVTRLLCPIQWIDSILLCIVWAIVLLIQTPLTIISFCKGRDMQRRLDVIISRLEEQIENERMRR